MKHYSQYGEESVLDSFFSGKEKGFCVDVGASDGELNSNSRYLIESLKWSAVLIEPNKILFDHAKNLYKNTPEVMLLNIAIHTKKGKMPLHLYGKWREGDDRPGQSSTLSEKFKQYIIDRESSWEGSYINRYEDTPAIVDCVTLKSVLKDTPKVDFLSIDTEGVDMEVLKSNDWELYRPSLICSELMSMPEKDIVQFMSSVGYKTYTKTQDNIFFQKK